MASAGSWREMQKHTQTAATKNEINHFCLVTVLWYELKSRFSLSLQILHMLNLFFAL